MSFDRERFMPTTYGHATSDWEATRNWTARRLYRVARDKAMLTYSDLCDEMARAGHFASNLTARSSPGCSVRSICSSTRRVAR